MLGEGELTKKLSVTAHSFSKSAVEKIEAAGGTVTRLREPVERKKQAAQGAAPGAESRRVAGEHDEAEAEAGTRHRSPR